MESLFSPSDPLQLAGILANARPTSCLLAPTVNCWRILAEVEFIPHNVTWGPENRNALIRVKTRGETGTYFENRLVCGSVNPYLCMAATIAAGIDGVKRELPLPPETRGQAANDSLPLPRSLGEALDAMNESRVIVEALGEDFIKCFTAIKRHEIELCRENDSDPDWEKRYYFEYT